MKSSLKVIIAGGGTGGHIFPAIAIANALKEQWPGIEILFVGANGKMEMTKVPQAGYPIKGLTIAGFNRGSLFKNIGLPWKLLKSFFEVAAIFTQFRPDAVIGVGGYSSFPVLRYAQLKKIPTFIHESNSFAGRSNIMLGKKATLIFTATDGMEKFFPANKIVVTGNPVRKRIVEEVPRNAGVLYFGLDVNKVTVLCIGGSLGAKNINEAIAANLGNFEKHGLQLVWQTGKVFYPEAMKAAKGMKNIMVTEFITEMEFGYAAGDVVISRSGAMAIAELCVLGKPVIFVPYPFASEDHQTANAMKLVNNDAARMITDKEAASMLVNEIISLAGNQIERERLSRNITSFGIRDADKKIAKRIIEIIS